MKKRLLSMLLVVVMMITMVPTYIITSFAATCGIICTLTSFAGDTEQNQEKIVDLNKTAVYVNSLTDYASIAEYLWIKDSSYFEAIEFSETTEKINSIIHTANPDVSIDSVFDRLLDVGYKTDVGIDGAFYDSIYSDKYLFESMNLCAEDIETISVESKAYNSGIQHEYVISLKDCFNPQKDNKSSIDHITNDFITFGEIETVMQETSAAIVVKDTSYLNYQDIIINMVIKDGLILHFKISYIIDISLDLNIATTNFNAKGKVIVNNEYEHFSYYNVSNLSEAPYKNFDYEFLDDDTVKIKGYHNTTGELVVPSEIAGFSVSTIGARAFEGSTYKNVYISSGVTTIGQRAFYNCHLGNVTLPNTIKVIESGAFSSLIIYDVIENLYYVGTADDWVKISFENNPFWSTTNAYFKGELVTDVALSEEVTSISCRAFSGCESLTSITIPDSVTEIGEYAFSGCKSLKHVKLSNNINKISDSLFHECRALKSIVIPDGVTIIDDWAFAECYSLNNVVFPSSITTIGECAFYVCDGLNSVLYKGTKSQWENILIEGINNGDLVRAQKYYHYGQEHSFDFCETVATPTCENEGSEKYVCLTCGEEEIRKVDKLGHDYSSEYIIDIEPTCYTDGSKSRHCSRCDSNIDSTVIPATNHIDKCYCYEYEILSEEEKTIEITSYLEKELKVVIPSTIDGYTVVSIGESTFAENSTIVSVELPNTVKTIGKNAFFLCYNLTKVGLPEGLTTIEYSAFSYCTGLINIRIPDSVTEIGESAFSYCSSLETINIPSEITYIRKNTFRACDKLTRVIVPEKVEIIDEYAFAYCSSLVDIWLPLNLGVICKDAFSYSNAFSTVHYAGTETEWNNITIADNKISNRVQIHYNVSVETIDSHWIEYTIDATCTEDGEYGYECSCGYKTSTTIPAIGHNYVDNTCTNCGDTKVTLNGWTLEGNKWAYYENGIKVTNRWLQDSVGWCYVGYDGYCLTNSWVKDSFGWCYLDANGRMVINNWVYSSGKWYFMDGNGYMVSNTWKKDSKGWCYLGSSGAMLTNSWVKDSVGWCYVGADGYCVTNKWVKDSTGWCYLDAQGRMVYNKWVKDSKGWCYVGSSGYMVYNQWVQDGGKWYYLDSNGYIATGTKVINGKTYKFDSNGVWIG